MRLDELPDLVLHKICLKLTAKDITSVQETNHKLFHFTRANRHYYSKHEVREMYIVIENGHRKVRVSWKQNERIAAMTLKGSVCDVMKSLSPEKLNCYDHDEIANMHPLWWKPIRKIGLRDVVNYQRYLPYFDRCTTIALESDKPMKLTEILASMETKNLFVLRVSGNGELECTYEDFQKIGRLSSNMLAFEFSNMSESSNISYDALLDMIEIGNFRDNAMFTVSRMRDNLFECLRKRDWIVNWEVTTNFTKIRKTNESTVWIKFKPFKTS